MDYKIFQMKNSWITPATITAIIPVTIAVGYGLAYAFERGYCSVFGIPPYLIELSINKVIFAVATVVILLASVTLVWYPYVILPIQKASKPWRIRLSYLAGALLIVILLAALYKEVWLEWVPLLITVVATWIAIFIIPIIWRWIKKIPQWIKQKIFLLLGRDKTKETPKSETVPTPTAESTNKLTKGKLAIIILFFTVVPFGIAFITGQAEAKMQDEFFITSDPADCAVLRIYGEYLICAPIDMEKGKISGNVFIKKVESSSRLIMSLEKIGRLGQK